MATELYVDGDLAVISIGGALTTGGSGTSASPYHTLAQAFTAAANGGTIHVQGKCRQAVSIASKTSLIVRQWSGETQAEIRGDVVVTKASWSLGAGNRYVATIGASLSIKSVVHEWDASTYFSDADIHGNHLATAASAAACEAAANSWFYDSVGGILHVNLNGTNPSTTGETSWCRAGNGLTFTSMTDCNVIGLQMKLWPDAAAGNGYGFFGDSCLRCKVLSCQTWDTGYHAIGFVGSTCVTNEISLCTCRGQRSGGSHLVFFGSSGSVSGLADSCNCHLYTLLTRAGAALDAAAAGDAFYAHTDGTTGTLVDIEVRNCTATYYTGHTYSQGPFTIGSLTATVSDANEQNWLLYPVRFVKCNVVDGSAMTMQDTTGSNQKHVAYVKCNLDFATSSAANTITLGGVTGSINCKVLFDSCVVYRGTAADKLFWIKAGVRLIGLCSTFKTHAPGTGLTDDLLFKISDTADVKQLVMRQCVFSAGAAQPFIHEDGLVTRAAANYDIQKCWYDGFGDTTFLRDHATLSTKANYKTSIDTVASGAIYDVTPGFTDTSTGNYEGTAGSQLLARTLNISTLASIVGINGRLYNNYWGPYQYAALGGGSGTGIGPVPSTAGQSSE